MSGFPAPPASTKGGDPAYPFTLEHLQTLPATATAWFAGAVVIWAAGEYKLCDADASVVKGIGIAGIDGKLTDVRMGSLFLPPCIVYSKYTQAAVLKVGQFVKTKTGGLWEGTAITTDAFAQILGKAGEGGGGTDPMTDIVQNDYVKLRLFDARG